MKKTLNIILLALVGFCTAQAESVTYRIVEYDAEAADFKLSAYGQQPTGSYAIFDSKYGATTGNRYNQIPRNNEATLWLTGWDGCIVNSITLSLCSNKTSGTLALRVNAGDESLFTMNPLPFNDEAWFGQWVNKDLHIFVDVTKEMTQKVAVPAGEDLAITLKAGTQEGSVYVDAITVDYTPATPTESALGWVYEKMEAKSKLADGDVVMLYRSGDAAGDIDGMDTSHYLDAIGIASTANVREPFVLFFTANKTEDAHWTLTDQYGRQLCAAAAQNLAWDKGVSTWDISLGYDGATIASTNTKYGTLRYNAPSGSYPRFWNYTSKSLALPFLYRRSKQIEPTLCTGIVLPFTERTVALSEQDTVAVNARLLPATVTDHRLTWISSDESVASVRYGIVNLHATGSVTLTVSSQDGGAQAQCTLNVVDVPEAITPSQLSTNNYKLSTPYDLTGRTVKTSPFKGERGGLSGILIKNNKKILNTSQK